MAEREVLVQKSFLMMITAHDDGVLDPMDDYAQRYFLTGSWADRNLLFLDISAAEATAYMLECHRPTVPR